MTEIDPRESVNKTDLRRQIDEGWQALQALIGRLSVEQLTVPTDAAGWTAKDHLIHLSAWEKGLDAQLNRQPTISAMGVNVKSWSDAPIDAINADILRRHRDRSLDDVLSTLEQTHEQVLRSLDGISEAELMQPAAKFGPDSNPQDPLLVAVISDTFDHYA